MLRRRGVPRRRAARASPGDPGRQRGAVTAEIAAALPALVLVVLAAVWTIVLGLTQLRCADAAREAARAAARGEQAATVRDVAQAVAPEGATIRVTERDGLVIVQCAAPTRPPVPFGDRLPGPTVRSSATAVEEAR